MNKPCAHCASSRVVMVQISSVYDGGLFYKCDDCGGTWHRWQEGSYLRNKAEPFIHGPTTTAAPARGEG